MIVVTKKDPMWSKRRNSHRKTHMTKVNHLRRQKESN